jgi:hypothetical protein
VFWCVAFRVLVHDTAHNGFAEETLDASSDRDFRTKERIVLRELKEARLRLRILRAVELLPPQDDARIQEANELIATSILGIWVLGFGIWDLGFGF